MQENLRLVRVYPDVVGVLPDGNEVSGTIWLIQGQGVSLQARVDCGQNYATCSVVAGEKRDVCAADNFRTTFNTQGRHVLTVPGQVACGRSPEIAQIIENVDPKVVSNASVDASG